MNDTITAPVEEKIGFFRSVVTGMLVGGVLALCNLYTGLKVGWGMGVSVTAVIMGFGLWQLLRVARLGRSLNIYENNLNQTAASAAAAISSAGLVAPIPALTMMTGEVLSYGQLVAWTGAVSLVGVVVGAGLRKQLLEVDKLPFPSGVATAETLREIHGAGTSAAARLWMLGGTAAFAIGLKLLVEFRGWKNLVLPGKWTVKPGSELAATGAGGISAGNLTFALEPTTMMYAVGALIGTRAGLSMLLGSILAWGYLAPMAFNHGWAQPGPLKDSVPWFSTGMSWLLWPGVAMMVTAALTSFAFSWRSVAAALFPKKSADSRDDDAILPRSWFLFSLGLVLVITVVLQVWFFSIGALAALIAVLVTFALALVAARVSGETNITPVGAMGKVTQLLFAIIAPGQPAANLMSANVTGGAASQCADLMHDLKTGQMIGAKPRAQFFAQIAGAITGAFVGCAGYLILIKDPAKELLTEQWPAPSVAAWKAVAELFQKGVSALPPGALEGMIGGAIGGVVLAVLEKLLPAKARLWVPSPTSFGLAFVIPAYNVISMALGATAAWAAGKAFPNWAAKFLIVAASGLIAGESLAGVALAIRQILAPD